MRTMHGQEPETHDLSMEVRIGEDEVELMSSPAVRTPPPATWEVDALRQLPTGVLIATPGGRGRVELRATNISTRFRTGATNIS